MLTKKVDQMCSNTAKTPLPFELNLDPTLDKP